MILAVMTGATLGHTGHDRAAMLRDHGVAQRERAKVVLRVGRAGTPAI